ncbi:MAG TPA: TPM domain-containing protein [Pyrinomonadaceae bacterium]|jgi:tetratricopeptide (TPR) repeat protein
MLVSIRPHRQHRHGAFIALACFILALLCWTTTSASAQTSQTPLPQVKAYVNDTAEVLDGATRQQLETILKSLHEQAGVEFALVTVKTTGGEDIFDYSLKVAREWGIGGKGARKNALMLLVSTEDGKSFAHVSRLFKVNLPDGLIGEMNTRIRDSLQSGKYGEALSMAVQTVAATLSAQRGLTIEGVDQKYLYGTPRPLNAAAGASQAAQPAEEKRTENSETATVQATPVETPATENPTTPTTTNRRPAAPRKGAAAQRKKAAGAGGPTNASGTETVAAADSNPANASIASSSSSVKGDESEEVETTLTLPLAERIEKLRAFIESHPRSSLRLRATELMISSRAALGDERLKAGDRAGGLEQFRLAVAESPAEMSDKLFVGVIGQLPFNLFLRGERAASHEIARQIETKVKDDPRRLVALATFYLQIEDAEEAARLSELAIKLAPELAAAHQALGAARRIALRLDEAAAEYARALELDPKSAGARRSLADLRRAAGKPEEALTLYREQLQAEAGDRQARTGLVLALFDAGKRDEAERELEAVLKDEPRNLVLLAGAAYWYAAHGEGTRAFQLAQRAVELEPRYTWAHIALAHALLDRRSPLDAERALRFARQYGRFPTLDYELANTLASMGLYEEAATELARSFQIKDGEIHTQLAGRTRAHAPGFIELLAPERRASIFQPVAADSESNARILKGLLALNSALNPASGREAVKEAEVIAAVQEFTKGDDAMRTYRQLYAASRLLKSGVALQTALELTDAAGGGVEAALTVPAMTVAVQAEELSEIRSRAISRGGTPDIPEAPRNVLASILRGRIEAIAGWTLFQQDKMSEAVTRLRRAAGVLPEGTPLWHTALWHLGAALESSGSQQEALGFYIKSYNVAGPDPIRRAIIEALYRKVNGSLEGLDEKIGPAPGTTSSSVQSTPAPAQPQTPAPTPEQTPQPAPTPTATPSQTGSPMR